MISVTGAGRVDLRKSCHGYIFAQQARHRLMLLHLHVPVYALCTVLYFTLQIYTYS